MLNKKILLKKKVIAIDMFGVRFGNGCWNFENYNKNPIVLLEHDPQRPVGKALNLIAGDDGSIMFDCETSFADLRFKRPGCGYIIKKVSFFDPKTKKKYTEPESKKIKDIDHLTMIVEKAELIEISFS